MFLTLLTFISAISISVIAAGYSIIGLATLFAGAFVPIVAMGSALEVGKLVAASWLYHNWRSNIPRLLKTYLFLAIIISITIWNKPLNACWCCPAYPKIFCFLVSLIVCASMKSAKPCIFRLSSFPCFVLLFT